VRDMLLEAGGDVFDYLSPSYPDELVTIRLAAALRFARMDHEAEMNRAQLLDAERNRVVVQLAGAVAHKLKQPLAVAWGYLEMLLEDPSALEPALAHQLREIHSSLRTMDEVVNRLQRATVYQTRKYAGDMEILDIDEPLSTGPVDSLTTHRDLAAPA